MNKEKLVDKLLIFIPIIMLLMCNIVYAEDMDYNIGNLYLRCCLYGSILIGYHNSNLWY